MKEIAALVIAVVIAVSLVSSLVFHLGLMSGFIRIYQGDLNATQEVVESVSDKLVSSIKTRLIVTIAYSVAGALGLGSLAAFLKKQ